ncbi:VOC family protein [Novosphingobium panipatense]|jgi:catechol 2,3-dioxygenase-like lactoylglutathione lyase family enzyme|uniref:VOC family protein n=1 Tax=Novosphingobium TaxID=165696 RepID=UPI000CDB6F8C|nr:VOC family protein [Novosphingobium sp. HII-3]
MVLKSVRLGSNDLARSRAFYDATFAALGLPPCSTPDQYPVVMWDLDGTRFVLGPARDGEPCTPANGGTIIFEAQGDEAVRAWHAAGLARGGTCAGAPEPKPQARGAFGAYLRDPDGNKLAAYHGLSTG